MNKELGRYRFGIVIDLYYLCNVVGEDTVVLDLVFHSRVFEDTRTHSGLVTKAKQKQTHEN